MKKRCCNLATTSDACIWCSAEKKENLERPTSKDIFNLELDLRSPGSGEKSIPGRTGKYPEGLRRRHQSTARRTATMKKKALFAKDKDDEATWKLSSTSSNKEKPNDRSQKSILPQSFATGGVSTRFVSARSLAHEWDLLKSKYTGEELDLERLEESILNALKKKNSGCIQETNGSTDTMDNHAYYSTTSTEDGSN